MGKKAKTILVLVSMICLLMGNLNVAAAEMNFEEIPQRQFEVIADESSAISVQSNPSLAACEIGIGAADNGVEINFVTTATQTANEIGVKNVIVQEKVWYGWKDIPASSYYSSNSSYYIGSIVYTGATKGTTYRIKCTHYAKFGSTELTLNNTSSEIVYN